MCDPMVVIAASAGKSAAHGSASWLTNPGLTVFTWITFLILFALLYRFGWETIVETLIAREEKIEEDFTTAEEEREKAEQLRQERQEELNEAHAEAREIVENGRKKGEEVREEIVSEAEDKAESMIEEAEEEIERERKQAFEDVEGEVGTIALNIAEKLLEAEIDEQKHSELIDDFLSEIDKGGMKVG